MAEANGSGYGLARRYLIFSVCWSIAMVLSACSNKLGPDFKQPEVMTSKEWLNAGTTASKANPARNWWKLFDDPILNSLVQSAFESNYGVKAAAVRILQTRAKLGIARSLMFPQLSEFRADGLYEQLSEQDPYDQDLKDYNFPYFQTGLDTAWELDIWGKFRRGIEASAARLAVQSLEYDDLLVSLTAEVATAYVQIRTFEDRLKIARDNAALQQKTRQISESQFRNGINTELDMHQANALYQRTLAEITHLETGLKQSRYALSELLGMQPNNLEKVLKGREGIPEVRTKAQFGIPNDMLRRRPDIRKAAFEAAAESAEIGIAKSELFPRLTLVGSVGFASGQIDAVDALNAISPAGLAGRFGPTIRWPVFQFGRLLNNVRAQDAKFEASLAIYRNTVIRALREVEDSLVEYQQAQDRVARLEEGVSSSRRAAELSLLQYQNGLEDYTRVLNSQLFLVDQQDQLLRSRGEVAKSLILAYKALGGGWEIREGKPLIAQDMLKSMTDRTDWGSLTSEPQSELFGHQQDPENPDPNPTFEGVW